ncbi:hypothetical protein ABZ446_28650 [Streptomyces sp. NPDC005813]|uniref:hypothetical protein n=1 Tax=Streptomyces sp. NPDC005813 TaxID=3155592 RepID=UPI0033E02926
MGTITVKASALFRNDSVRRIEGEMAYLVDSVRELPNDRVSVTFSSGDIVEYAAGESVTILDD